MLELQNEPNVDAIKMPLTSALFDAIDNALVKMGKRVEGRILTQVDASIGDPTQRKALKDVLREVLLVDLYSECHKINRIMCTQLSPIVGDKVEENDIVEAYEYSVFNINQADIDYNYTRTKK